MNWSASRESQQSELTLHSSSGLAHGLVESEQTDTPESVIDAA